MASRATFPLQPYGISLIIETSIDPNFCLESTTSSAGTPIEVSQCATRDNQRWSFLQSSDNSIVIADGGGQCVGDKKSVSLGTVVGPCNFGNNEHFLSSGGQIATRNGKECLTYAKATQNAGVFFEPCVTGQSDQTFLLEQ